MILTTDKAVVRRTQWRQVHYASGLLLTVFVGVHLFNHLLALAGPTAHIAFMTAARTVYRNPLVETLLLGAVGVQIMTGLWLAKVIFRSAKWDWTRLHIGSGLYLALFLLIHVGAVLTGRIMQRVDTNLYFGAAGLNTYPYLLFFVPYYGLAMLSFFGHIAAIHRLKMNRVLAGISPARQAKGMLWLGVVVTVLTMYALTNHFRGLLIPTEYQLRPPTAATI